MTLRVYIGFDPREKLAYDVAEASLRRHASLPVEVIPVRLDKLRKAQIIWRRFEMREGRLWDVLSKAHMSTEFAISRFAVPILAHSGWSLFVDPDVLFTADVAELFALADPQFAVMCVKHPELAGNGEKMDGQVQSRYARKNWSSVVLYNSENEANDRLTLGVLNNTPGRDLHGFGWLHDEEIGELPSTWNHLVGVSAPRDDVPKLCHFTQGTPDMPGYENCEYADRWRAQAALV